MAEQCGVATVCGCLGMACHVWSMSWQRWDWSCGQICVCFERNNALLFAVLNGDWQVVVGAACLVFVLGFVALCDFPALPWGARVAMGPELAAQALCRSTGSFMTVVCIGEGGELEMRAIPAGFRPYSPNKPMFHGTSSKLVEWVAESS